MTVIHFMPANRPAAFKAAIAADIAAGKTVLVVKPRVVRL